MSDGDEQELLEEAPAGADEWAGDRAAGDGTADPRFLDLLEKLHAEHNFDFRQYKAVSLLRRVRRRMTQVRVDDFATYMTYLDQHPDEHTQLLNVILINVTSFFRDPEAWAVLRDQVLPRLLERAAERRMLRIWSAGCSSGEEPYSLAMLFAEGLDGAREEYDVKIYATDIDEDALTSARAALYRLEDLKNVPPALRERHFAKEGQTYRVRRDLRKWCIFGRHDLTQDAPLSHIDLLVCRNVLIYFDNDLQDRLVRRFQYAIRDDGYLFLGRSESLLARSRRFVPRDVKWRIFQRVAPSASEIAPGAGFEDRVGRRPAPQLRADPHQAAARLNGIIESLASALVVADPADRIVVWNPAAERLFEIPADAALGKKFRDLDISYRIERLRARVEEVRSTQAHVDMPDLAFTRRTGDPVRVNLRIAPLYDDGRRLGGVMISADDVSEYGQLRAELDRLTEQSATANEELQSTNEELETTNEELQSTNEELETTNEELQSTNEELETTIEELQSTNAELATLNTELERRTAELQRVDILQHTVLDTARAALFVLDPDGVVTSWNRAAAQLWSVPAEAAVGRPFSALPTDGLTRLAREPLRRVIAARAPERVDGVPCGDSGERRSVTVELTPVLSPAGELIGVVAAADAPREASGHV